MNATESDLCKLLRRCVVKVATPSDEGTGFFIRAGLVLTCRHVVQGVAAGAPVTVTDYRGESLPATLLTSYPSGTDLSEQGSERWPDLALLEVGGAEEPTAVIMTADEVTPGARVFVGCYPAQTQVGYQTRDYQMGPLINYDDNYHQYQQLKGDSVDAGLSGAPVLTADGFVCGYVRLSRTQGSPLGGWVVPVAEVLTEVPEVNDAFQVPGLAAYPWVDLLTAYHLKMHDRDEHGRRLDAQETSAVTVDLELVRHGSRPPAPVGEWEVSTLDGTVPTHLVRTADLGDGVLEAVDHWSRRHTIDSKEHVQLLGQVLYRALMPKPLADLVEEHCRGEIPLLRLRVDKANALAQIPWEYACGEKEDQSLSTDDRLNFSRFVDREATHVAVRKDARVLVVVNRLKRQLVQQGEGQLVDGLAKMLDKQPLLHAKVTESLNFDSFSELIEQEGPWDVVHYIGSFCTPDTLAFVDYDEYSETAVEVTTVAAIVRKAKARVVVLQQYEEAPEPVVDSNNLLSLLSGSVRALVLVEHAQTPKHVMTFDSAFYAELGAGHCVEAAVQKGRRRLKDSPPAGDYTAFGSVSVTTTHTGDVRLLAREPKETANKAALAPGSGPVRGRPEQDRGHEMRAAAGVPGAPDDGRQDLYGGYSQAPNDWDGGQEP